MTEHFIIAGAQRCGTTSVYHLLERHPDICMAAPVRPEPKFFLDPGACEGGYEEYLRRHFAHRRDERVLGEKSTSYIEREDAIARIHGMLPDVRLVFVLRDPILRAYSNWRFSRINGLETLDFEDALDAEAHRLKDHHDDRTSVNPFAYAARGHYVRYLDRWARHFDPRRFIVVTSEKIFENPEHIRDVYSHLGVSTDGALLALDRINASPGDLGRPSTSARDRLRREFAQSTRELHDRWNVDVSGWL